MKTLLTLSLLFCAHAQASTITFGSGEPGTVEGNTINWTNVPTNVHPAWAAPIGGSIWESTYADSTVVPNGTVTDFWFRVFLPGAPAGGYMNLMVDDEAAVYVNDVQVSSNLYDPPGPNCGSTLPNCLAVDHIDLSAYLTAGYDTIDIKVLQQSGETMAFDAEGAISYTPTQTPEPATIMISGLGLVVFSVVLRRRNKASLTRPARVGGNSGSPE